MLSGGVESRGEEARGLWEERGADLEGGRARAEGYNGVVGRAGCG